VFEVVAEAEVTQHFEEGVVTRGVTDVFQVVVFTTRTHATLRGGRAGIITLVETKEDILELVHPGVGKQQSRVVVRHQGAAGNYLVSLTMEKIEKRLTDLSGALAHNYPEIKLTKCRNALSVR
jgi:glycine/serine hydroxymethyltransferase